MITYEGKLATSMSQLGDEDLCIEIHAGETFSDLGTSADITLEVTTHLDVILVGLFNYVGAAATVADGQPQLADKVITDGAVTVVRKDHADAAAVFGGTIYGYKTGT